MTIIFAILLFSLLIFVHELGHFLAAKASGVQVNEFAMFMGPALVKWGKGETLYSVRCIPIGGYCAMEGEDEDTDNPRSFQKAAWWKRLIILVAGAAMNLIVGFLLLGITYAPAEAIATPMIAEIREGCTIVSEDGLHVGDRFLEIDGEKIYMASDVSMVLSLNPDQPHDLVVERNGETIVFDDYTMETHLFPGESQEIYGFYFGHEELDFAGKIRYTWLESVNAIRTVRLTLQMLLTGKAGFKDLGGPVLIVKMMSEVADAAPNRFDAVMNILYFGGFIAINLAVMNLLPIPALDGGRAVGLLLTTGVEKITRKKVNPKYESYIHGVGMILLLALMAVVMFKDILNLF